MFVQALTEYARTHLAEQLQQAAWEEKPVPYLIEIGLKGDFLGIVERMSQVVRGKTKLLVPQTLTVPRCPVSRTRAPEPRLGADEIKYVLGPGPWTPKAKRRRDEDWHRTFVDLVVQAAAATHEPSLQACASFYRRSDQVARAREALCGRTVDRMVALSVGGPIVTQPRVREFWNDHYQAAWVSRAQAGGTGECLVCGKCASILLTHDKIKGLTSIGGQSAGVSLMSVNNDAFRSYGWEQNQNSPVCPECSAAYVLSLNALLQPNAGHRKDVRGVGFIFWLKKDEPFNLFDCLDHPDRQRLQDILAPEDSASPANELYLMAVLANGGRLRVLSWSTLTLERVKRNLTEWFNALEVQSASPYSSPLPLWRLLDSIHSKREVPAHLTIALLRRAVEGRSQPLGREFLDTALRPGGHAAKPNRERIVLIRLCGNDLISAQGGEGELPGALDVDQKNRAYLSGRLLAVYESLHVAFSRYWGDPRATLLDRHYGLAASSPETAFVNLEFRAKRQLRRLGRVNPAAARALEQRIQGLRELLQLKPRTGIQSQPGIEDQAWFALGYYHQREHSVAQAMENQRSGTTDESGEI